MDNTILCGDSLQLIPKLPEASISLVITSPPYAEQRRKNYSSVQEANYPTWTCRWMSALRPKLTPEASVIINIRPHVRGGCISDYVLRTRLALREQGWFEIDEMIWHQPDKPPLGHNQRPRRAYESLLWYSTTNRPYADPFAAGHPMKGWGGLRSKSGIDKTPLHRGHRATSRRTTARVTDVITVATGTIDKYVEHPAMMPRGVVRPLIKMLSRPNQLCADPFVGSGTVPLVCQELGRRYLGIDAKREYADLARKRLAQDGLPPRRAG